MWRLDKQALEYIQEYRKNDLLQSPETIKNLKIGEVLYHF